MHPARFFGGLLATIPLEQYLGLRMTLWMIALAPLFVIRRLGTIASITPEERTLVLTRLVTHRIYVVRQLAMSMKAIATLLYAQSAAVRAAMTTPLAPVPRGSSVASVEAEGLVSATRLTSRGKASKGGGSHEHAA